MNMTDIQIRVATERDAPVLTRLRYELRSSAKLTESKEQFAERSTLWMRERLHRGSCWRCWIAESEQTPVGNIWAQLVEKIPNPAAETECYLYVTNFYVREEHRGKGIGTRLLSEALTGAKQTTRTRQFSGRESEVNHFTYATDLLPRPI